MKDGGIFAARVSAWAPGIKSSGGWEEWALGEKEISCGGKEPELLFTDPLFRRRLSQISKMTIQVVHDLLPFAVSTKLFFISFRGELKRQYQINKNLIEENAISPASFSLSVFNAPAALAAMALGLKGGYTALYPGKNSFSAGLNAAQAALLCGTQEELCLIYADEEAASEYGCFFRNCPAPAAYAVLLTKTAFSPCVPLPPSEPEESPLSFLRKLLLSGVKNASS